MSLALQRGVAVNPKIVESLRLEKNHRDGLLLQVSVVIHFS